MKRFFSRDAAIIFCIAVLTLLCAWCSVSVSGTKSDAARDREAKEEAIYQRGYEAGYDEGYREAMNEAPEKIDFYVEEDLWNLDFDIEDKWGMYPEEAVTILENYVYEYDEPVSDSDLHKSILAICEYYYQSREITGEIEEYWID